VLLTRLERVDVLARDEFDISDAQFEHLRRTVFRWRADLVALGR
jgi:hypothetical protein